MRHFIMSWDLKFYLVAWDVLVMCSERDKTDDGEWQRHVLAFNFVPPFILRDDIK